MALSDHYTKRYSVRRVTLTASSHSAAGAESWEDVAQDQLAAIEPLTAAELELFGKTSNEVTHRLFTKTGIDVRERDLVIEGNPIEVLLGIGSTRYEVEGVIDPAGKGRHLEVLLLEHVTEAVDGG